MKLAQTIAIGSALVIAAGTLASSAPLGVLVGAALVVTIAGCATALAVQKYRLNQAAQATTPATNPELPARGTVARMVGRLTEETQETQETTFSAPNPVELPTRGNTAALLKAFETA